MCIAECHQELFYCSIPSRIIVFGFPLGLWPTQPQVLDHTSSAGDMFHVIEWVFNQIRSWLVTLTALHCSGTSISSRQVTIVEYRVGRQAPVHSYPLLACRVLSSTVNTCQERLRLQNGTLLTSLYPKRYAGVVFKTEALLSVCEEQPTALATACIV